MSINGIGGGGFRPTAPAPASQAVEKTGKKFDLSTSQTQSAKEVASATPSELQKVQSGELTMDQYLDQRVDTAVSHVSSRLSPEQLGAVRQQLKDQLSTDPVLRQLVKQATGSSPPAPSSVSG
jgi:hypothetical protein